MLIRELSTFRNRGLVRNRQRTAVFERTIDRQVGDFCRTGVHERTDDIHHLRRERFVVRERSTRFNGGIVTNTQHIIIRERSTVDNQLILNVNRAVISDLSTRFQVV